MTWPFVSAIDNIRELCNECCIFGVSICTILLTFEADLEQQTIHYVCNTFLAIYGVAVVLNVTFMIAKVIEDRRNKKKEKSNKVENSHARLAVKDLSDESQDFTPKKIKLFDRR